MKLKLTIREHIMGKEIDGNSIFNALKAARLKNNMESFYDSLELTDAQKEILTLFEKEIAREEKTESELICPECGGTFTLISIKNIELEYCPTCQSLWFDEGELKALTGLTKDVPADDLKSRESKLLCPVCQKNMEEFVFKRNDNLLVDKCIHGVYLQGGEFTRALFTSNKR